MSNNYGPNLYAYLEQHWRALGTNQNAWCDQHPGLLAPTVGRWRTGTEPKLDAFRAVSEALGVSIVDVLIAAGVIRPDEVDGHAIVTPTPPRLDDALRLDDTVPAPARRALAEMLAAFREVEAGRADRRHRRS